MSDMLLDLIGQKCSIKDENEEYLTGSPDIACDVLDADDEWIKVAYTDRTGHHVTRFARMETVESILMYPQ